MDSAISSEEWRDLNEIALAIHNGAFDDSFESVLALVKDIVPYDYSLTHLIRNDGDVDTSFNFKSNDIPAESLKLYMEKYVRLDFINWYMQTNPSQVFRESDIIPIELQEKSLFMKNWMEPIGLYWAVGVLVDYEDVHYASLFLYRAKDKQPFSDKELEILRVVDDHLGSKMHSLFPDGFSELLMGEIGGVVGGPMLSLTLLTRREREIVECIRGGVLRSDLAGKLFITENTLNKHFDNMYKKLAINSYEELLQLIR